MPEERIQTMVEEGWVTLKEMVELQDQKSAADVALRDLKGVKGVINEIDVKPFRSEENERIQS